jgi:aspartyl-tRNA(Asn)/glutamyl-tRNA(Gln) amidotransferase subunit B
MLRNICRFLGVTEGVMQKGHMRFEPNINTVLTLDDGRTVATPVVEIKNLNSFKALEGAVRYELAEQPQAVGEGPARDGARGEADDGVG